MHFEVLIANNLVQTVVLGNCHLNRASCDNLCQWEGFFYCSLNSPQNCSRPNPRKQYPSHMACCNCVWAGISIQGRTEICILEKSLLPFVKDMWLMLSCIKHSTVGEFVCLQRRGHREAAMGRETWGPGGVEKGHVDSKGGGRCPSRGGGNKKGGCAATKGINYQIRTVIFSTLNSS